MALHVVAGGGNVRAVRAHRGISPRASVLHSPAWVAEIETLPVFGLCSAGAITKDRRPAPAIVALTSLLTQSRTGPGLTVQIQPTGAPCSTFWLSRAQPSPSGTGLRSTLTTLPWSTAPESR